MTLTTAMLLAWIKLCAVSYGVEPEFALAVAHVESGCPGHEFRLGPLGRKGTFIGPMGIHKDFRKKWAVDDPRINVAVGVRALRGQDQRKVLQRYNAAFDESYWRAVLEARRQYRKENEHADLRLSVR